MSSLNGRRGARNRGRSSYRGGSTRGRGSGGIGSHQQGHGGDNLTFSICKYYVSGVCNRGDACLHRHAVKRMSEAQVSARKTDGTRGAVRSLVQWKEKMDHVFTACDDGTLKMWTTTDGSNWTEVTSVVLNEWRHIGSLKEVDSTLYVGYGMPYSSTAAVTVDNVRVMDLKTNTTQECSVPEKGFAHPRRINCVAVVKIGSDLRVYTGGDDAAIRAWQRPTPEAPLALLGTLEGHIRGITALVYSGSNGMLWSASEDGTIRIWNVANNLCEHVITGANEGHTAGVVALTMGQSAAEGPLKEYIISASRDGYMGVFQTEDGKVTYKHKCGDGVSALAVFDPTPGMSALLLVGYEDGTIAVRNFPEFALAFELHPNFTQVGHTRSVLSLLPFNNPDIEDSYFLSAGEEGRMICWKVHKLTDDPPHA